MKTGHETQFSNVNAFTNMGLLYFCGQANTVGIAVRIALLGGVEGTCITRAKSEKVTHEYSTILGIQESVCDILINLKEIVLKSKSNSCETQKTFLSIFGPKELTARDIVFPPSVEVIDTTQYIATLTKIHPPSILFL
jgi:DNA-directed RNA polymerase subunit alpha